LQGVLKNDLPKHFGNLEKLLGKEKKIKTKQYKQSTTNITPNTHYIGSHTYFSTQANVGDLAIFYSINLLNDIDPTFIDSYPNLKKFYERLSQHKGIKAWLDLKIPVYFKLD